jgi:hypothetical protein
VGQHRIASASRLLGLDGFEVSPHRSWAANGGWWSRPWRSSSAAQAVACGPKSTAVAWVRDLPAGGPPLPVRTSAAEAGDGRTRVTSLEAASRSLIRARCCADGAARTRLRWIAVDREGPPDAGATGTRRARPRGSNRASSVPAMVTS